MSNSLKNSLPTRAVSRKIIVHRKTSSRLKLEQHQLLSKSLKQEYRQFKDHLYADILSLKQTLASSLSAYLQSHLFKAGVSRITTQFQNQEKQKHGSNLETECLKKIVYQKTEQISQLKDQINQLKHNLFQNASPLPKSPKQNQSISSHQKKQQNLSIFEANRQAADQTRVLKECLNQIGIYNPNRRATEFSVDGVTRTSPLQFTPESNSASCSDSNGFGLHTIDEVTEYSVMSEKQPKHFNNYAQIEAFDFRQPSSSGQSQNYLQALRIFKTFNQCSQSDLSEESFNQSNSMQMTLSFQPHMQGLEQNGQAIDSMSNTFQTDRLSIKTAPMISVTNRSQQLEKDNSIPSICLEPVNPFKSFLTNKHEVLFKDRTVKFYPPRTLVWEIQLNGESNILMYQGKLSAIPSPKLQLQPQGFGTLYKLRDQHFSDFVQQQAMQKRLIYTGEWRSGHFEGWGKLYQCESNRNQAMVFHGKFRAGLPNGAGTIYYGGQSEFTRKFIGNFVDGNIQGQGNYFDQSGIKHSGFWIHNKLVNSCGQQYLNSSVNMSSHNGFDRNKKQQPMNQFRKGKTVGNI